MSASAAATDSDKEDGVWAVVDEVEMFEDWMSDSGKETDWSLLNEANSEEEGFNDSPIQHIPDADAVNAKILRHILLSRNKNQISLHEECDDDVSIPDLQSVSDTDSTNDEERFTPTTRATHSCTCSERNHDFFVCNQPMNSSCNSSKSKSDLNLGDSFYNDTYLGTPDSSFVGAVLAGSAESRKAESDLYDSGASRHMTPFRNRIINFMSIDSRPI